MAGGGLSGGRSGINRGRAGAHHVFICGRGICIQGEELCRLCIAVDVFHKKTLCLHGISEVVLYS